MIALVRRLDPDMRAARKRYEDQVESVVKKNSELIARARFSSRGRATTRTRPSPPGSRTARCAGWKDEDGRRSRPSPTFAGAFERATGEAPFDLPASWLKAKDRLNPTTPVRLRDHQRHHRRQLRLAGGEPGRGDRRPGVRRQPALAGRRLRVRPPEQPHRRGGQPRADRGAAGGLRRATGWSRSWSRPRRRAPPGHASAGPALLSAAATRAACPGSCPASGSTR